jgi:hypothetical protein
MQDHAHTHNVAHRAGSFWTSRAFLVCAVLLILISFLLWTEHLAHALWFLPYLLLLACPLMHLFMHGGHGGHGSHGHRERVERNSEGERS